MPNSTKSRTSSACQQNTISMVFCWRADDGPTLNAGLVALWFFRGSGPVLLRSPIYIFVNFQGRGRDLLSPPHLDPRICTDKYRGYTLKFITTSVRFSFSCILLSRVLAFKEEGNSMEAENYHALALTLHLCKNVCPYHFSHWKSNMILCTTF